MLLFFREGEQGFITIEIFQTLSLWINYLIMPRWMLKGSFIL